ncbi:MAG: RHS repeat-associated core domain-containing protein [Bacteroidales bacterium]|nr:RHS repeat-associated core domain-containing protein [Bacteroidales bacterium]
MITNIRQTSFQSLYPHSSPEPGRMYSSDNYRYSYNGKEQDNEIKGTGNSIDFGARMYDSRLGRWLSLDPLQAKYPSLSPYQFCANNPILFIDPNGKEIYITDPESGETFLYVPNSGIVYENVYVNNVNQALDFLYNNSVDGENRVGDIAFDPNIGVIINVNKWEKLKSDEFRPSLSWDGEILWNDRKAEDYGDGKSSPIVSFAHELDHAWRYVKLLSAAKQSGSDEDWTKVRQFENAQLSPAEKEEIENSAMEYERQVSCILSPTQYQRFEYIRPNKVYATDNIFSTTPSGNVDSDEQGKIDAYNQAIEMLNLKDGNKGQ